MPEVQFTVKGKRINATEVRVERGLLGVEPERIRVHGVEINGRDYPVRQAMAAAFDLERRACFPNVGARVFEQLGFHVFTRPPRPRRGVSRREMRRALPHRTSEIGPAEEETLEVPPIRLAWCHWERWLDLHEWGAPIMDMPLGTSGVYEARLRDSEERLTIGRASCLRSRILTAFIRGHVQHTSGEKIREFEDVSQVVVRWAKADRPAAAEEALHLRHIDRHGRLPKHTIRT